MERLIERKRWSVAAAAGVTFLILCLAAAAVVGWLALRWHLSRELCGALRRENYPAVRALVRSGADPNTQDEFDDGGTDNTPLILAVQNRDLPFIRELIALRVDLDNTTTEGITPLLLAVGNGRPDIVAALLKAGADANLAAGNGYTPLMHVARQGDATEVRLLLRYGARVHLADRTGGRAVLSSAHPAVISLLKQAQAAEALAK